MNEVMHNISYLKSYSKDPKRFNPLVSSVTLEGRNGNLCCSTREWILKIMRGRGFICFYNSSD